MSAPQPTDTAWYHRLRDYRLKLALGAGALGLLAVVFGVLKREVLSVAPASGVPLGDCVRTETHIATLIQSTDPHLPEISGRGGNTTTSISILLIPLDGSAPKKIGIAEGLAPNQFALAKILGSDGHVLWFDVNGLGGVDLERLELLKPADVRHPHVPAPASPFPPDPNNYLSAGFITAQGQWLGLHAEEELAVFAPKKFVRRVESQQNRKQMRHFYRGTLDSPVDDRYHQILSMETISETGYFNAAFLRMDKAAEPFRCADPDGALMVHTDKPVLGGKLIVSRVDAQGNMLWSTDTGIDRFHLSQILPGTDAFAFVGTVPPVEGKLSEPLVVLVDNASGELIRHSLWR
jgi:hypothetical protein